MPFTRQSEDIKKQTYALGAWRREAHPVLTYYTHNAYIQTDQLWDQWFKKVSLLSDHAFYHLVWPRF